MKHITIAILTGLGFTAMSASAYGQAAPAHSQNANKGKAFGKPDIDSMCNRPTDTPKPKAGYQYDGQKASSEVLNMKPGKYSYPSGGAMLVWTDSRYLLKLPSTSKGTYGTDGDDLLASGGIVGGCSLEQLSEAIRRNTLTFEDFTLVKPYN